MSTGGRNGPCRISSSPGALLTSHLAQSPGDSTFRGTQVICKASHPRKPMKGQPPMRLASGRPSGARAADRVLLAVTSIALAAGVNGDGVIAAASAAPAYASVLAAPAVGHTITT